MTPSMRIALRDLHLKRIAVVYPGPRAYDLSDSVRVIPLASVAGGMKTLFPD